ncbi:MAG: hypothetical protein JSV88_18810 [Candidatus Aminicenantes bacterium]|nr:MAG: hypothetical protein JSV88_18810 [Candidatus Aminicenantes bacterium]
MKLKILIMVILFALSSFVFAEKTEEPTPILKAGDVKHFIKTFPLLKEEFKKFEVKYDGKSGTVTYPEALKVSEEFLGILKKHGWDEHFFAKAATISLGYSSIVYKKEVKKADPQFEKSIKEIESNPALSEAMKKQLIEQLKSVKGIMKSQQDVFKKKIHKADLDLIKPHIEALKKMFEES